MSDPRDAAETHTGAQDFLVRNVAPVIGVMLSEFLALGPLKAVLQCRKLQNLGEVNPLPFPLLLGNGIGWTIYSAATRNPYLFAGNIGAVVLALFYLLTAHTLTDSARVRTQLEVISLFFVFLWGSVGFVAAILEDKEQGIAIIGILGNIVVFGLFASPLSTFPKIVKRKDSSSINRPFAICQVLNCIVWVSYGLATNDIYLATPNFVGLLLGLAQVSLILLYPPKPVALESPADTKVLTGGEYSPFDAGSSS